VLGSEGAIAVLTLSCCPTLSVNLHAQGDSDVAQQIKQLQQDSRNAQMKNDASWAHQHLADGFMAGNSWGDWETKDDFIKDLHKQDEQVEERQHQRRAGGNLRFEHRGFTLHVQLRR